MRDRRYARAQTPFSLSLSLTLWSSSRPWATMTENYPRPRRPDPHAQPIPSKHDGWRTTDGTRGPRTWEIVASTRQRKLRPVECTLEKELLAVNAGALANEVNIMSHV